MELSSPKRGNKFSSFVEITGLIAVQSNRILKNIPDFYFGRFDIRFNDFEAVRRGADFTIVEANGAGAESTHIWDRDTSLLSAWKDLMKQYRLLYSIGDANRKRGAQTMSWSEFRRWHAKEKQLTAQYPATD
jgi:hypothetical protein